jgi:hypothetical protein
MQADNATTCHVADFVHSISAQMSQAPQLSSYFQLIQVPPVERLGLCHLAYAKCMFSRSEILVLDGTIFDKRSEAGSFFIVVAASDYIFNPRGYKKMSSILADQYRPHI